METVKKDKPVKPPRPSNPQPKGFAREIEHYQKLLTCDQFIIAGSYSFYLLGLTDSVTDLDIIVVNPDEECLKILQRIAEPPSPEYPDHGGYYRVVSNDTKIDFWTTSRTPSKPERCIELKNGWHVAYPLDTVKAKQGYKTVKQILQLRILAEKIYTPAMLEEVLQKEMSRLVRKGKIEIKDELPF